MPRPANSTFNSRGIPGTRATEPDKKLREIKSEIANSALSVTLGERLRKRCPPVNVKGDRPTFGSEQEDD